MSRYYSTEYFLFFPVPLFPQWVGSYFPLKCTIHRVTPVCEVCNTAVTCISCKNLVARLFLVIRKRCLSYWECLGCKKLMWCFDVWVPATVGRQIGLIVSESGTLLLSRSKAMSLSKFKKLKDPVIARTTYLVSGADFPKHLSCSPNVTLIINHMNLKKNKLTLSINYIIIHITKIKLSFYFIISCKNNINIRKSCTIFYSQKIGFFILSFHVKTIILLMENVLLLVFSLFLFPFFLTL